MRLVICREIPSREGGGIFWGRIGGLSVHLSAVGVGGLVLIGRKPRVLLLDQERKARLLLHLV